MIKRFYLLFILSSVYTLISGQSQLYNMSVISDSDSNIVVYNRSDVVNELMKVDSSYQTVEDFIEDITKSIEKLPVNKKNILFYIHGYLGSTKRFVEASNYVLSNEIYQDSCNRYGLVINIQWEADLNYVENYTSIPNKVAQLYEPFESVITALRKQNNQIEFGFLLHSMGHRVFYHLYKMWEEANKLPQPNIVISCAGDIEENFFDIGLFDEMLNAGTEVHVFHHESDKTLMLANLAKPFPRLGIGGPKNDSKQSTICTYNVTSIDDFETIPGSISLHRYFYDSPRVRSIIKQIMCY